MQQIAASGVFIVHIEPVVVSQGRPSLAVEQRIQGRKRDKIVSLRIGRFRHRFNLMVLGRRALRSPGLQVAKTEMWNDMGSVVLMVEDDAYEGFRLIGLGQRADEVSRREIVIHRT